MAMVQTVAEAVLLLDYVKSSGFAAKFGDQLSARRKQALEELVMAAAEHHKWRRSPKDTGDGFFMTFAHERDAVGCAVAILQNLSALNRVDRPELEIHVRIGITFGQLTLDDKGERKGEPANLAARFESVKPDELQVDDGGLSREAFAGMPYDRILISGEVYEGVRETHGEHLVYVGLVRPKDIRRRYEAYSVDWRNWPAITLSSYQPKHEAYGTRSSPIVRTLRPNRAPEGRFEFRGMDWYEGVQSRQCG